MIHRLFHLPRLLVVAVALLMAVLLSYLSIRNAIAAHDVDLQTLQGYERATRLESGNFRYWYLLGRYWQYSLEDADTARAIQTYTVALSLNPRSADIWSDLAAAYESDGNISGARDAYQRAKRAYPLSPEVAWRYGNFLLRQGELDAAFSEVRRAVEIEPARGAEALSRALRVEPNIDLVLDRVLPALTEAYVSAIRDQLQDAHVFNAVKIWERLAALHPGLPLYDSFALIGALTQQKQFADARRVWEQAIVFAGFSSLADPAGSILWDGGFESGLWGGGFAWTFPEGVRGVQMSLETREKHSGNRSLRLLFDGKYNLHLAGPCHDVLVEPSTAYSFSAWVRTLSISTDQGIRFQLTPVGAPGASAALTEEVHGSQPWHRVAMPWTARKDVREVQVCVARLPSREADDKIQGMAWVDDVALIPGTTEPPKP
jgi:hypothetical protein